ncbi:serine kinase [Rubrobacter tropicus]|uniref:Serine kinase n=1 Tax=Rubrobacter tropicus TaxID=2653851 RepID=A0A6G8QD54_9ACTN|nr:serine kinase [Rubrobacter tropicus]QIN84383.1 serine kinase [Rubrobacter tropicus]
MEEGYSGTAAREAYLYWAGVGAFLVRDGREIVVDPAPEAGERVYRNFVSGPVLSVLLQQRGFLILHASAVSVCGMAVAFLGPKGWGKSTTAAALHARGHPLVADDVTAVRTDETGPPVVSPGAPQLKLWPEAVASLGEDPDDLPRLHPDFQKRTRPAMAGFVPSSLPLGRVYLLGVLGDGEGGARIDPLGPQQALVESVRHTFGSEALIAVGGSPHFFQCANVVNNVTFGHLRRPRSLAELSEVARLIEEDLERPHSS